MIITLYRFIKYCGQNLIIFFNLHLSNRGQSILVRPQKPGLPDHQLPVVGRIAAEVIKVAIVVVVIDPIASKVDLVWSFLFAGSASHVIEELVLEAFFGR